MTFESFKTAANKSLADAKAAALQLADETGEVKWLTLLGGVDRGKTHLAVAICRRWLSRDKAARYSFVPLLLNELRDGFELLGDQSYRQRFQMLCNVPLLVLDDLGVERTTSWGIEQLQTIIHYRGNQGLPLVVTSNKPLGQLAGDDEHRIGSRLQRESWCRVVVLDSPEHRLERH
jgi:DNA replication protein DnaC